MATPLFESCVSDIGQAYQNLGYVLGWRFLNVSRHVFDAPARLALLTLNPAGNSIPPDHPWQSCENGSSYLVEKWDNAPEGKATLQVQVQLMFKAIANELAYPGTPEQLIESSLISQFVPFRSPRFSALAKPDQALQFAHALWSRILPVVQPRLIVCLGREVQRELRSLIPRALNAEHLGASSHPTGWGTYSADIDTYERKGSRLRLLYLPHLSTWTLFKSQKCKSFMPLIIHEAAKDA